jgi:hypothetical protein
LSGWQDLNLQQPAPKLSSNRSQGRNPAALLLSGMVQNPPETARFQSGGAKLSCETSQRWETALMALLRARADEIATDFN